MKIRTSLSLWYLIVSILIVSLLSTGIYFGMQRVLQKTIDDDLEIFTDMIESSYNPLLGKFEEILWKLESAKRFQEVYLIVYNSRGMIEFASPMTQFIDFKMPLPGEDESLGFTRSAKLTRDIPVLRPNEDGYVTFRGITRRMYYNNHPIGWIQAGLPITDVEQALANLFKIILIVNIFALLFVGAGGYLIIGKFLSPVKLITQKANAISQHNLSERIEVKNEQDELGQLTLTLNNLLERLHIAFDTQKRFMADAAHELKTPLAVLRTHWENELNNSELNDDFKDRLGKDIEIIGRLNQMINKLMFLAQTEDVFDKLEWTEFQLDDFLREIISDTKILADLKHQEISAVELTPIKIRADQNRMYQLFFNLIDNAIKYTPEKGKIWIRLRDSVNGIEIQVKDSGVGIPPEHIPLIFDRFYRVDKDRSRRTGGSGLGLSICKLIVDAHKGTISAESQLKKGTIFTVIFPHTLHVG